MNPKIDRMKVMELAEKHVRAGRLEDAIAEYRKLLEGEALDLSLNNTIGDLYLQLNQPDRAVAAFKVAAGDYENRGQYSQALAIYKKISKFKPDDADAALKMGEMYERQDFAAEAKAEYLRAAARLKREKKIKELIALYERLVKLDRQDPKLKLELADLYVQNRMLNEALETLNDVAEDWIAAEKYEEAGRLLVQARELKESFPRTVANLMEIFRKRGKRKEALSLVEDAVKRDKGNLELWGLLGGLHLEDQNFKKAEDIFDRIATEKPSDVNARVKLGRARIGLDKLDEALEAFEPLITSLLKKQKEDKAIGLLGLIATHKRVHLPTLEKLASIYKAVGQKKRLEVVYRIILQEAREKGLKEKMMFVLSELVALCPEDKELGKEYKTLRRDFGFVGDQPASEADVVPVAKKDEEAIQSGIATSELYLEQGLIRNAKRILENLRLQFMDDPRILEKLELIEKMETPGPVAEDELQERVGKAKAKEVRLSAAEPPRVTTRVVDDDDKIVASEIFMDTGVLPEPPEKTVSFKYFDVRLQAVVELEMIEILIEQQSEGDMGAYEKDLTDILRAFRKAIAQRVDQDNYELHYNLGVAYLEQGLWEVAIDEFQIASHDNSRALDCFAMIGQCYAQKGEFEEARRWVEKALSLAKDGDRPQFTLKYELACFYLETDDKDKALALFREVEKWDPSFRDLPKRLKSLTKSASQRNA
ncbi:MAG: tetratricopeptide repeat protein [Candidatus Aminicenantes bacterium]|nr:tetratricopeptide repeat protein [Candidatus Aminicenantes bacterium]